MGLKKKIKGLWWRFTNSRFVAHISFLWHWKNFFFLMKYPFYKTYNRWTSKFCGYAYTEYDSIDPGWQVAFGKQLSDDIKKAGKESRKRIGKHLSWKKMITFEQIKEKWGELCLYASATKEIRDVLDKYELLSSCYCINCGKPARYRTTGWVEYYCEDCFIKDCKPYDYKTKTYGDISEDKLKELKKKCRLTEKDIPKITIYDNGKDCEVDIKEKYNINFSELWDL